MTRPVTVVLCATALFVPFTLHAQSGPPASTGGRQGSMEHQMMMGTWKEMNVFHALMAAAWHPASEKNDLAPLKASVKQLAKAAEEWSASKAPAMPHSCHAEAVTKAIAKVSADAKALDGMVAASTGDDKLKAALKELHDTFEVAEKACGGHGGGMPSSTGHRTQG